MKLGFIGLGRMGNRMVVKLLSEGHEVVVWNRSEEKSEELKLKVKSEKLKVAESIEDLIGKLDKPRIVWSMVPALRLRSGRSTLRDEPLGSDSMRSSTEDPTQEVLGEVAKYVEEGDIVIDGGNSRFSDTQKWYETFKSKNIRFLGIGVSGGVIAAKAGYPLMVGGDKGAYGEIKPILDSLAKPGGGHEYFGEGGAGHYVKMIHNAIEYGYMQSIGEGFGVLEKSPYDIDLVKVAKLYQKGTLVSGFMMERTIEVLSDDPKLEKIQGVIGKASGETIWAVEEAGKQNLLLDVIRRSLEIRNESETDLQIQKSFAARMVSALRNAFGRHEVKRKQFPDFS